jgi:hypothetical protein
MSKITQEEIWNHLNLVSKEIIKMKKEFKKSPEDFGKLEHRLYWAIRGVNPHKAICSKHKQKITKNDYGEFICGDCIEEGIHDDFDTYDENMWFDPDNEPYMRIYGIQYGNKIP